MDRPLRPRPIHSLGLVPAEKNATNTMVDAAVYDIASRRLLLRAPGTDRLEGRATPVNVPRMRRADAVASFERAADDMVGRLEVDLAAFEARVRAEPDRYAVVRRPGHAGGGALGAGMLPLLAAVAGMRWLRGPRRKGLPWS